MANTDTWNTGFEASPADIDNLSEGSERIRDLKLAIRERLSKDHYFNIAGVDIDHGEHEKVSLRVQTDKPTPEASKGYLYSKDVSAKAELFYEDEDGNEIQLTSGGYITTNTPAALLATLATIYPIGCIYTTTVATDPATVFGFGTWAAFGAGKVLLGDGGGYSAGATGGEATHILTAAEMPAHTHAAARVTGYGRPDMGGGAEFVAEGLSDSTGGGGAHNNLQPYIVVYFWTRTA